MPASERWASLLKTEIAGWPQKSTKWPSVSTKCKYKGFEGLTNPPILYLHLQGKSFKEDLVSCPFSERKIGQKEYFSLLRRGINFMPTTLFFFYHILFYYLSSCNKPFSIKCIIPIWHKSVQKWRWVLLQSIQTVQRTNHPDECLFCAAFRHETSHTVSRKCYSLFLLIHSLRR